MKKLFPVLFFSFISAVSYGQMEVGYNTTDVGGEFLGYRDGNFFGVHLAANSRLHNSFHVSVGYYSANNNTPSYYYNKTNGGLGLGLGYRYYIDLRPHAFFVGVKANLFTNKVILNTQTSEGPITSSVFIPAIQTGYMALINDMFFITPVVEVGAKTNLQSKLSANKTKATVLAGISCGFKF